MGDQKLDYVDQCTPLFMEFRLMKEFITFQQQTIKNVYLIPSYESSLKWFGVLFIHEGLYQGAILRFTLDIPANYLDGDTNQPVIKFDQPPFHPLVDPETGEFHYKRAMPDWNLRVNQLWQLINYLKKTFIYVEKECNYDADETSLDAKDKHYLTATSIYRDNYELFVNKIASSIETSKSSIYQPVKDKDDPHAIIFSEVDSETLKLWKGRLFSLQNLTNNQTCDSSSPVYVTNQTNSGLSWVQNDILFSKSVS